MKVAELIVGDRDIQTDGWTTLGATFASWEGISVWHLFRKSVCAQVLLHISHATTSCDSKGWNDDIWSVQGQTKLETDCREVTNNIDLCNGVQEMARLKLDPLSFLTLKHGETKCF